jgi:hypothetical protein
VQLCSSDVIGIPVQLRQLVSLRRGGNGKDRKQIKGKGEKEEEEEEEEIDIKHLQEGIGNCH